MTTVPVVNDQVDPFVQERAELQTVQASVLFQRAPNLSRILAYICQKHFQNESANLKEYNIAVEALGRPPDFDPQVDAIVRVDAHLLRKRLHSYYEQEGKHHDLQIVLPSGQYAPEFVRNGRSRPNCDRARTAETPSRVTLLGHGVSDREESSLDTVFTATSQSSRDAALALDEPSLGDPSLGNSSLGNSSKTRKESSQISLVPSAAQENPSQKQPRTRLLIMFLAGAVLGAGIAVLVPHRIHPSIPVLEGSTNLSNVVASEIVGHPPSTFVPDSYDKGVRILCGAREDYIDAAGFRWRSDRYFSEGAAFSRPVSEILRSMDPALYSHGRHGVFHYDVPVPPGVYELHLLFAETQPGVLDGMREVSYTIGAGQTDTVDVASDAGGANMATMKVYTDVRPGQDGKIHLSFWSTDGFVNALEILPQERGKPNPLRISALPFLYSDRAGQRWLPDRFFLGGRNTSHMFSPNGGDLPLFSRERFGNFNYSIPVARNYTYQLTLYMAERYWGPHNSGLGGVGSRIFDVDCNQQQLLHDFDLLKAQGSASAMAIRFHHLRPDSAGKLNLRFIPVTNYPMINALEVDPE
jgi:hypothetical protein